MKVAKKRGGSSVFFQILSKRREDFIERVKEYINTLGIQLKPSTNRWKCDFWIPRDAVEKLYQDDPKNVAIFLEETKDHYWIPVSIQYKTIRRMDTLKGNLPKIIIGRRYSLGTDKNIRHCFQRLVYTNERTGRPFQLKKKRARKNFHNLNYPLDSIKKRQLKMILREQTNLKTTTMLLEKCIFVDFETITDFQDNLSQFPIAQDTSMIFMIGAGVFKNGNWEFTPFIVDSLDQSEELKIVQDFYSYLSQRQNEGYQYFVHWSPAEQVHLRKVNQKWKELKMANGSKDIQFLDLMSPFKQVYPTQSVSLKRIAKSWKTQNLIQTDYGEDEEIGDGLSAMASIVANWNKDILEKILDYNHKDTRVLAEIMKQIT